VSAFRRRRSRGVGSGDMVKFRHFAREPQKGHEFHQFAPIEDWNSSKQRSLKIRVKSMTESELAAPLPKFSSFWHLHCTE
jgi:hypothetical protein